MKRLIVTLFAIAFGASAFAQDDFPYSFTVVKDNEATRTKDQCRTGTCWSFATLSFVESELIRMGKGEHDLSEMFNVRVTYPMKADSYVRYHGKAQFGPGSLSHDVINAIKHHGMVPESVYSGLNYGKDEHDHSELDAILEGMVKNLVEKNRGGLSSNWRDAVGGVLDVYLGEYPESFDYEGKSYSPESFRDELGFNSDDYVSITSFTHHPYYDSFVLEIPDNFSKGSFYNVTIDELVAIADNAIDMGMTIAWDADVSEKGFSFRNGMAILPVSGTDKSKLFTEVVPEETVTQENRQEGFDSFVTTDDHLMHITGIAKDQNGVEYYITKNSWGTGNEFDGFQYVSDAYFKMKTIAIMVHKDAIPKDIAKKLGL